MAWLPIDEHRKRGSWEREIAKFTAKNAAEERSQNDKPENMTDSGSQEEKIAADE
ncbi:MAG: hypothetical protein K5837_01765 [Candidatus Saccharibacteria bacterium]|nr:hypothetical protein [Candidatus Saccharibacteria bacterium]